MQTPCLTPLTLRVACEFKQAGQLGLTPEGHRGPAQGSETGYRLLL
jgi:hypothetical protein